MTQLLVVDDDRKLRQLLKSFLEESGFQICVASNAAEARSILATHPINIMVLDIMMAGEDGVALTSSLRTHHHHLPIILLTARDTLDDRVDGLNAGADDYLTKPFEPRELVARIQALLRRDEIFTKEATPQSISLGLYQFDLNRSLLLKEGEPLFLTSSEKTLLQIFAGSPRKPFSREELAQRIGHRVSERSVDVQIVRLRRKIGDNPRQPRYLQTVRYIGYGLYPDEG